MKLDKYTNFAILALLLIAPCASCHSAQAKQKPAAHAPAAAQVKVWANTSTGVYHREGTRWYGKTKHGEYMTEAEAKAKGYRPAENGQ